MPRDARSHLVSMLDASSYLLEQAAKVDLDEYLRNQTLRFAFRYNFTIIGESMAQLRQHHPVVYAKFDDANKVVDFRNFIVHHYWDVDDAEVWSIVIKNVPPLHKRLAAALDGK
jgi:uncharacterized protein with HEPN domain